LFFSCSSSKHIDRFQKIQYKSITRGYSPQILLQGDTLKYFENNNETLSLIVSKEVKTSLNKLLKKVHPETIGLIKAPSNKFQYDGVMYTTLEVTWNGKNYKSSVFDDNNPPKKLSPFIYFLLALVK
jgi:hypothetical protein